MMERASYLWSAALSALSSLPLSTGETVASLA